MSIRSNTTAAVILLVSALLAAGIPAGNEIQITWKTLADVTYKKRFNKEFDLYFMYPSFGPKVQQLEGKRVSIRGYMIPIDEYGRRYVISGRPMAQCFFCGGAGPESLIELQFKKKSQRFKTDEIRTLSGILSLNKSDVDHLSYILSEVEVSE